MISRRTLLGILTLYVVMLAAAVWGLIETRSWVIVTYDTPAAEKDWNAFREAVEQGKNDRRSTVKRRAQWSNEPPIKRLFADNFLAVLLWSIVFLSILYWSVGIMLVGALRTPNQPPAPRSPDMDV